MRYIVTEEDEVILFPNNVSYKKVAKGHTVHSAGVYTLSWNRVKRKFDVNAMGSYDAQSEIEAYARIGDTLAIERALSES